MYESLKNIARTALVYTLIAAQSVLGSTSGGLEKAIENNPIDPPGKTAPKEKNPVEKYAVLVSGNSEKYEPGAKNRFWLALTDTYKSLIELGYKKENIQILYPLSPNKDLPRNQEISDYILSDKNKGNIRWASKENLKTVLETITKKTDSNDRFRLYFVGHGSYKNGKSTYNLFLVFFDICESGKWSIDNPNYITITTCGDEKQGAILSPDFSFSARFTKNETEKKSDINKDGELSIEEVFERTKAQYRKQVDKWLEQGELEEKDREFFPDPKINLK